MRTQANEPETMLKRRVRRGRSRVARAVGATTALLAVSAVAAAALVAFLPAGDADRASEAPGPVAVAVAAAPIPAAPIPAAPIPAASIPAAPIVATPVPAPVAPASPSPPAEPTPLRAAAPDVAGPERIAAAAQVQASPTLELPADTVASIKGERVRATQEPSRAIEVAGLTMPNPDTARPPSATDVATLMGRARDRIRQGDIAGARRLLERAALSESSDALFALAETYDSAALARWGVIGTKPDNAMARSLYERAASQGVSAARERLLALVQ
jgi:hypothetical protein